MYKNLPPDKTHLDNLAYRDDLTGLNNRRYLNLTLPLEISKAKKSRNELSLFMIDYDGFKDINDTYGHLGGDRVLVEIAAILKKEIGRAGIFVRYAGDEFTVVIPGKGLKEAVKIAENLLQSASGCEVELKDGKKISNVTLSIGVASYPDNAYGAEELIDKADQALYSAKRMGKNRAATIKDLVAEVHDRNLLAGALPCKEFIDRKKEIESLKGAYECAKKAAKKLVIIKGDPGVGKTRLMLELADQDKTYPVFFLKCRRENLEQEYGAISDAFNGFLDFLDARKVLSALTSLDDIYKYALLTVVDKIKLLPIRYSKSSALSARKPSRGDIFSAFVNFIKALKPGMISVLIDDALWIDSGSMKIIDWLLEKSGADGSFVAAAMPISVPGVVAERKNPFLEFINDKKAQKFTEAIILEPLTEKAVSELIRSVFPGPLLPSDIEKKLCSISMGFPSNAEEIIRSLLDSKIVYPKNGKWAFDEKRLDKIPSSLKEIFSLRLSGLDSESKDVLSKAAVLGNDFNIDVLKFFSGKNEGQLLDLLDRLKDKGILQQSAMTEENVLSFANSILKENIYNSIEKKQLQQLHHDVAALLKDSYGPRLGSVYGKLKYHSRKAGMVEAVIEKSEPSIEEVMEAPLSEESLKIAPDIASSLRASWINSQLYPPDNQTRLSAIESLKRHIDVILKNDRTLTVTAADEDIIFNGRAASRKKVNVMLSRSIASLFSNYGISSMTFKRGVNKKEFYSLFSVLSKKEESIKESGGLRKLFKGSQIVNIKVDEVRYRKASDIAARSKKLGELFKNMIPTCSAVGDLFSISDKGLEVNKETISDAKKTIDSAREAIKAVSKENISEDNKSFMILEGLRAIIGETAKEAGAEWENKKVQLAETFLSLEPILRTKVIKECSRHGKDVGSFFLNALSGLDKRDIVRVLTEGRAKGKLPPEEFNEFSRAIAKSQRLKNRSYKEVQDIFKEAGISGEAASKTLNDIFIKSFFESKAKGLIDGKETEALDKKTIDNLKPLTEALMVKGDKKSVEKLVKSLLLKAKSHSRPARLNAIKAIGRAIEALLEKEAFDICGNVCGEFTAQLMTEEDINSYAERLKVVEMIAEGLIHKRNLFFLKTPLNTIKQQAYAGNNRPDKFRNLAETSIKRVLSPDNLSILLLSFGRKPEKDYLPIMDLIIQLGEKVLNALMELLFKKDDVKLDPFDIYMKKRYISLIMKNIGEKAISRLKAMLDDKRPFVVKNIIHVLGNMDDKKYVSYIEKATKYPDKEVREEASKIAKKLKGKKGQANGGR